MDKINLEFFNDQAISYRHLQAHDKTFLIKLNIFIDACRNSRLRLNDLLITYIDQVLESLPDNGIAEIEKIISALNIELIYLKNKDPEKEITELEQNLLFLKHRIVLAENIDDIKKFILSRRWASRAKQIGGSTRHITIKYDELFQAIIAKGYIEHFRKTLDELSCTLYINVETIPRKGITYRQITMETSATPLGGSILDKVLSEGEKRAVALADFLTEIRIDPSVSGIIFDDPVTSLDLRMERYYCLNPCKRINKSTSNSIYT